MPLSALVKTSETGDHSEIAQNNLNIRRINNDVSVGERLPLNWSSGINSGLAVVNQLYIPCDDSPANFPPQWGGIPGLFIFGTNAVSSIVLGYGNTHLYNSIIVGGDIEYRIVSSNLSSFANYLTISGDSSSISAVVLGNTGTATTLMGTVYGNGSGLTNLQTTNFVGTLPLHNYFTSLSVPNTNGIGITNLTFPHGLTSAPTIFGAYVSCVHNDASSGITTNTTKIPSGNFWVVVAGNMKEQAFGVAADNTNIIVNMTSFASANYITVLWNGVWVGITNPTNFVLNPYYSNF